MNWLAIFNPLVDAFNGWRGRKHELKLKKHDLKIHEVDAEISLKAAKAKHAMTMVANQQTANINWELLSIRNSGWRDEYMTLFTTAIVALVFVPYTQPFMVEGFTTLDSLPYWFQISILVVYSSAFGVRAFDAYRKVIPRKQPKVES